MSWNLCPFCSSCRCPSLSSCLHGTSSNVWKQYVSVRILQCNHLSVSTLYHLVKSYFTEKTMAFHLSDSFHNCNHVPNTYFFTPLKDQLSSFTFEWEFFSLYLYPSHCFVHNIYASESGDIHILLSPFILSAK